jgi:hypothetical protein
MCLELVLVKVSRLLLLHGCILASRGMIVSPQRYSSPCPDTFQYRLDQNGELYGTIGVYSLDQNVVKLNVELSVGNHVDNFNGRIEVSNSREQISDDIHHRRPIRYKLFFPRWENIPPRITMIMVNDQVVCSGPPLQLGDWINVLSRINLQHSLTVNPLAVGNTFVPVNDPTSGNSGKGGNFFLQTGNTSGGKTPTNPFLFGADKGSKTPENPFLPKPNTNSGSNSFLDFNLQHTTNRFLDNLFTTTPTPTIKSTTRRTSPNSLSNNDLLFPENPFLNSRAPPSNTPKTPSRVFQTPPPVSKSPSPPSQECGISMVPNPLVVNGNAAPAGAFPWLAAMFLVTSTGLEYKCSATLVSKRHIVTAAHCLHRSRKPIPADKLIFVLGKHNIKKWTLSEGEKMVEAKEIRVHPDYVPLTSDADIAVVVLSEDLQFTKYIRPICMWSGSDDVDRIVGQQGKVVGWGRDETDSVMTAEPRQVNIPVVSQEQCLRSAEAFAFITSSRTFCAGRRNGEGPCNGDSGSGFIMQRNGKWFLRGVVSISTYDSVKQSCDLSNYVVFTDVSKFRKWLFSII